MLTIRWEIEGEAQLVRRFQGIRADMADWSPAAVEFASSTDSRKLALAYALALSFGFGALGVWFAMVLSMIIQGCLMALRFYRGGWRSLAVD